MKKINAFRDRAFDRENFFAFSRRFLRNRPSVLEIISLFFFSAIFTLESELKITSIFFVFFFSFNLIGVFMCRLDRRNNITRA